MQSGYIAFSKGEEVGLDRILEPRLRFVSIDDVEGELGGMIERMACLGQVAAERSFCEAQSLLYHVLDRLLNTRELSPSRRAMVVGETEQDIGNLSERAIEFLNRHIRETVNLDDIADHLDVSVSTLCHKFKLETGETLMQRYTNMKIELAKHLMARGQRMTEVAEHLGFCDVFHFSKTFKRVMGLSPRAYRDRGVRE